MSNFTNFSVEHFFALGIGLGVCIFLIFLGFIVNKNKLARYLSVIILIIKIVELVYRHLHYKIPVIDLLPLHLCNITIILAILMMFFQSKILFQPVYFWSIGAVFALITPEVRDGIYNFATQSFFITHYFLIFSTIYALIHFGFRPTKKGAIGAFILLNIFAVGMYYLNVKLGTNYLYVNRPPAAKTLIDLLGPWPYYILSVEGIYIVLTFILYLPFRVKKTRYSK